MKKYGFIILFLFCTAAAYAQQYSLYQGNYNTGFSGSERQCEVEIDRRCDAERRRQLGNNRDGLSATLVDKYMANYRANFKIKPYAGGRDEVPQSPTYNTGQTFNTGNGLNDGLSSAASNLGAAAGEAIVNWIVYGIQRASAARRERQEQAQQAIVEQQLAVKAEMERIEAVRRPSKVDFTPGMRFSDMSDRTSAAKFYLGSQPNEEGFTKVNFKREKGKKLAMSKATEFTKKVIAQKAAEMGLNPVLDLPEDQKATMDELSAAILALADKGGKVSMSDVKEYDRLVSELAKRKMTFAGDEIKKRVP